MTAARSAGILLHRVRRGALEVYVAHMGGPFWARKDERAWSIPKGEFDDPHEDALTLARREFAEEIGSPVPEGDPRELGEFRQKSGKTVVVFALAAPDFDPAEVVSNTFELEWPPRSGRTAEFPEVDRAEWMTVDAARVRLVAGQVAALDALTALHLPL